jgi:hypothetical protein
MINHIIAATVPPTTSDRASIIWQQAPRFSGE